MADPIASVAVLGTGTMGAPMARNLAAAGLETWAWNRDPERAEPLTDHGIRVCADAADAAAGADAVVTMLADGDAVAEVMGDGTLQALGADAIWVQTSTVGEEAAARLAELAADASRTLVDAPVLGTKAPAEQGALIVLAAGPGEAIARCRPLFEAIGAETVELGEEQGAATRMKLVLNAWLLALTAGLAEAINLAEALGADPQRFLEIIEGGPIDADYAQLKGKMMIERDFEPSFALSLAGKDARLALEAAASHDAALPMLEAVRSKFAEATEMGHGSKDMAAVYEAASKRNDERPAAAP